ncbi:MAG TPA: ABC transporter permease [Bryobacteraceae bacterium]
MKRIESILWAALGGLAVLIVWQAAAAQSAVLPTPWKVVRGFAELARKGVLVDYTFASLWRVARGYLLAVALALPAGAALGYYAGARRNMDLLIQILRPISPLAWMPMAVVWFGVGDAAPIFLIFLGAFFPILLWTAEGVRTVPRAFLLAGRNFCGSHSAVVRRVLIPAAFPKILIGLRAALGIAWLVVVAAEMIAVNSGLGYLIIDSRNAGQRYDLVIAGMLLIGAIGLILDGALQRAEKLKFFAWGFRHDANV